MYNNQYPPAKMYNPNNNIYEQNLYEQIDGQIKQLQQMREQVRNNNQQPAINQTFQLVPNNRDAIRYANNIDEVYKDTVLGETPFFSKDMSVVWIKDTKGDIRTYELNEIIPKDSKDIQIEYLQSQIEELKGMIKNDANVTNANAKQITTSTTINDKADGEAIESTKSTSISKVSGSKKK